MSVDRGAVGRGSRGRVPVIADNGVALITKYFEYSLARLPIIVSDVKSMAEMTRTTGQGEVFTAADVDDHVRAVRAVPADPDRCRAAYDAPGLLAGWTWEAQAEILDELYSRLLGRPREASAPQVPQTPETPVLGGRR